MLSSIVKKQQHTVHLLTQTQIREKIKERTTLLLGRNPIRWFNVSNLILLFKITWVLLLKTMLHGDGYGYDNKYINEKVIYI